jgi:tetratricopeptide (TPR) repeat protein
MGLSNADRRDLFEDARALAELSTDKKLIAGLLWSYGASFYMAGDLRDAQTHITQSVRLADEIGDPGLCSAFRVGSAVVALVLGPLDFSLAEARTAIELTGGDSDVGKDFLGYSPRLRNTINRSMAYSLMGRLEDAREDAIWGLAEARRSAELENVVIGLYAMNLWAFHAGDGEGALVRARETLQAAEMSTRYLHTYAWEGMGMACLLAGHPDDAIRALESAAALVAEGAGGFQEANTLALLSASHAAAGDAHRAFEVAERAVDSARTRGARVFEAHALLRRANARRLLEHDAALVADDLALARAMIEETGAHGYAPFLADASP